MDKTFELDDLISLHAEEVARRLKEQGRDYIIKRISSFKLREPDTEAVVKVAEEGGKVVLYVCGFKSGKEL